jgi:probable RNA-binding protein EIF1AD
MSSATKRKHVTREVIEEYRLPEQDEQIVKVVAGRGNNLHEVADPHGETFLVSMPTKFRKNVWIKRGDFVFISPISEGDKVKGEISTVLYKDQIKYLKREGVWPKEFENCVATPDELKSVKEKIEASEGSEDSDNGDEDLFQNTNRPVHDTSSESEETDNE